MTKRYADTVRDAYVPMIVDGLRRLLKILRVAATRTLAETGLSAAQLFVLAQLKDRDHLSINELAALTMTDRSSVAAVVDRLSEKGLVHRGWSADDRRKAEVSLTARGRGVLRHAPIAPTQKLLAGLHQMTDAEIYALAMGLDRLQHTMGIELEHPDMFFEQDS